MAHENGEIVLPRRPFTDVHELVYLFHSWQLIVEADSIPEALRPLRSMPEHLVPAMTRALADAQAQLESAQAGTEISLRFLATKEFSDLMRWGALRFKEVEGSFDDEGLHPNWQRALELAKDFVEAALEQLDEAPLAD